MDTQITLSQNSELRFEISDTQSLRITLLTGTCEHKGQELLSEKTYIFKNTKSFLFTFEGCTLRVEGNCDLKYTSSNSNVPNIFEYFNTLKNQETKNILVVGRGRSTLVKILCHYFYRIHRHVLLTELDPSTGILVFPGVIGSTVVNKYLDDINPSTLAFFYGSTDSSKEYYFYILEKLSKIVEQKEHKEIKIFLFNNSKESIGRVINLFKIDEIIVVGDEREFEGLSVAEGVSKYFVPGSSGYVGNTSKDNTHRYFYGSNNELTPYSLNIKECNVVRVGEEHLAPTSALPLGSTRKVGCSEVRAVDPVIHSVLGISEAQKMEDVSDLPVVGFLVMSANGRVLCPQPSVPKCKYLIQGDIKYQE